MLLPCLRIYYGLADLTEAIFQEFHTLCIQYNGSDLVEDRDGYFFWSLDGREPTMREFRLFLSRVFVALANALGELFWKDGVYRVIDVSLDHTPHCVAEEQVEDWSLESVEDYVPEVSTSVPVLDKSEISVPVVTTDDTKFNDTETAPHPIVVASTEPTVTKAKRRKRKWINPDELDFSRFRASDYRAESSDEVKARWKRLYDLIHAKSEVTKSDDYAYHLYKKINIRFRSDLG